VYRASFGINYYDEGLINFRTAAGSGPGLQQSLTLNPGMPGFAPGGLNLQSTLPAFAVSPTGFAFPVAQSALTFTRNWRQDGELRAPVHQRVQPPEHDNRRNRRLHAQHHIRCVRPDDRHRARTEKHPVAAPVQLVNVKVMKAVTSMKSAGCV
jgi:hypothetical protein